MSSLILSPRINRELSKATFDEEQFIKDFDHLFKGGGFYFHGPSGVGKTLYACGLLKHCEKQLAHSPDFTFGFVSVPQLLEDIRKSFSKQDNNGALLLENYQENIDWLILDDIGVEKVSDWVLQTFYLIVNYRYEQIKPTIFTSNHDLNSLAARFGEKRIVSRIAEMTTGRQFALRDN